MSLILGRLLQMIPLLAMIVVVNWILIHLAAGDPSYLFVRENGSSPAQLARIRHQLGLDQQLYLQFFVYAAGLIRLDFGNSIAYGTPVMSVIADRVPATLLLAGTGFLVSTITGLGFGILAARTDSPGWGKAFNAFVLTAYSVPTFWLAQVLLLVFAVLLEWLPAQGVESVRAPTYGLDHWLDVGSHMVLPVIAYSIFPAATVFRLTYGKLQETLRLDFITATRAKGASEWRVLLRHALPNSILPVLTVIGTNLGFVLAGSVLVETIFGWPGVGQLLSLSILARDYPLILGIFTVSATAIIIANALADIAYGVIDPRIRG